MNKDFWQNLKKPIIALAPMDGYTDSAFRQICKEVNPAIIVFTEFTSADGLSHGAKTLKEKIAFVPSEQPIIVQLFGKEPQKFVEAVKYCEAAGFAGIDINMGCPARKVIRSEHGLALRKDPETAFRIVEAVAKNTKLPVSVKTRLGWDGNLDLDSFAKGIENAGANLITIHARFFKEVRFGPIDYNPLYELKSKIKIPIIVNGGITSLTDGLEKIGNLDGLMIGRAALGNPWVFNLKPVTNFSEKIPVIKRHAAYMVKTKGAKAGILQMRKHLLDYVSAMPQAKNFRSQLARVNNLKEIDGVLAEIKTSLAAESA
ncbi:MAG: hypothetical protein A2744_02265 [Candidatus Buchananbacteria bacterium RIFCSPHIGHO2_01_FULL_44_11]|uniref:tRNA-dihydrouridine synthase n=1 Tax=Candidatus Buchananbacteria bacterium RIFCSPHIGHO2_01_FULL_44_11 TaxID=1797535 RepID=A0A1G1Y106_9BACT|nr:MAG: hypothetical protein A2744_02265 [Candidatus Buchananbacteria bacterium RIFCSPHIGHO2_01_FULL_44_11]